MKKKEFLAGTVLLAASSALCLRLMKKVGERLKSSRRRPRKRTNKYPSAKPGVYPKKLETVILGGISRSI